MGNNRSLLEMYLGHIPENHLEKVLVHLIPRLRFRDRTASPLRGEYLLFPRNPLSRENHLEKVLVHLVPRLRFRDQTASPLRGEYLLFPRNPLSRESPKRPGFRTAESPAASLRARLSITGGRSLPVCRGRAPCMGSVGSSQSSRCVFNKVCSSRILEIGISGTFLYLSCEGIVTSSSTVRVSNSTLPSFRHFPVI